MLDHIGNNIELNLSQGNYKIYTEIVRFCNKTTTQSHDWKCAGFGFSANSARQTTDLWMTLVGNDVEDASNISNDAE